MKRQATRLMLWLLLVGPFAAAHGQGVRRVTPSRAEAPKQLQWAPDGAGGLTATTPFSLRLSAPGFPRTEFAIKPQPGNLRVVCTWDSSTPLLISVTAAAGHGLPGRIGLASRIGQSPVTIEVQVAAEQVARGPVYIEVDRSPLRRGGTAAAVHGTIVVSMAVGAPEEVDDEERVRSAMEEGRLLSPSEVNALEAKLNSNPHDWSVRLSLLAYYWSSAGLRMSKPQIIAARRRHILWAIENRPAASGIFGMPELQIGKGGPLGDVEGAQEAEQAWQRAVTADSRNNQVLLNAAWFCASMDPAFAERALLQAKSQSHDDRYWNQALGWLYAAAVASGNDGPFVEHARGILNTSQNADLLAAAAPLLASPTVHISGSAPTQIQMSRPREIELAEELALRAVALEPDNPNRLLPLLVVLGVDAATAETHEQKVAAEKRVYGLFQHFDDLAVDSSQRIRLLPVLADLAVDVNDDEAAKTYATQALELASKAGDQTLRVADVPEVIHNANDVLGRVALHSGNVQQAKEYLLQAAATPCGGAMSKVGPQMRLAQALLDRGEREVVLQYLSQMRTCWKSGRATLDQWIAAIRSGKPARLNAVDRRNPVSTFP